MEVHSSWKGILRGVEGSNLKCVVFVLQLSRKIEYCQQSWFNLLDIWAQRNATKEL